MDCKVNFLEDKWFVAMFTLLALVVYTFAMDKILASIAAVNKTLARRDRTGLSTPIWAVSSVFVAGILSVTVKTVVCSIPLPLLNRFTAPG